MHPISNKRQRLPHHHVVPASPAVGGFDAILPLQATTPTSPRPDYANRDRTQVSFPSPNPTLLPLDIISFSPFGCFCKRCNTPVALGSTCLRNHLMRHPEVGFGSFGVQEFVRFAAAEVQRLQRSDRSSFVAGDTFNGYYCPGCSVAFARKYHALRHCQAKNNSCLESGVTSAEICKTVCGRTIPAYQVLSPAPLGSEIPFFKSQDWLQEFVSGDEKVSQYIAIFHPIICLAGDCNDNMALLVDLWSDKPDARELQLADLLERAKTWLFDRARHEVGMIPANYRAAIQVFDGQAVGDVAINFTYTFRHFEANLHPELISLLTFVWRRSNQSRDTVLEPFHRTYNLHRQNAYFLPRLLQALFVERVGSGFEHPIIVEYCLARTFRKNGNQLTMIKCDLISSQVAATMALLRAGLCSAILSYPDTMDSFAKAMCQEARTSRVANILCPFIRQLKEMHQRKGTKRLNTISPDGDIAVDGFEFPKLIWSKLIANVLKMCKNLLSKLLDGDKWAAVLDTRQPLSVVVYDYQNLDFKLTRADESIFHSTSIKVRQVYDLADYDRLASYMALAFFGLGGGTTRGTEIDKVFLSHAKWHRNTVYYDTFTDKSASFRSQNSAVAVEHKVPSVLARCYLLFRLVAESENNLDLKKLIPKRKESRLSLSDATTELFNFRVVPSVTQVRQFFTSVSDYLFPDSNWDGVLCANHDVAEMSGHSATTHRASYSTALVNGRESVYRMFHRELGEDQCSGLASTSIEFSKPQLLRALRLLVGPDATFTCPEQERMVELVANSLSRHAHVGMPCGSGKSMGWMVPAVASLQDGRGRAMIVVVLPYKFLLQYQLSSARNKTEAVIDMAIEGFDGQDIGESSLPPLLQEARLLPDILFVSLEAVVNLIRYHSPRIKEWVSMGLVKRFVIDEVHTLLSENFRSAYNFLPSLVKFEVPVMVMSGTVPSPLVPYLVRHLGMSSDAALDDIDVIECEDCLGTFPSDFRFTVQQDEHWMVKAVKEVVSILGSNPMQGVHVLTSSKKLGEAFFKKMSETFDCRWVTADSTAIEQAAVAQEWSVGKFQILVSTTIALVGNENSNCHHVIMLGYMFNLMNVIQAIGRLRPEQRQNGASFRIIVPILTHSSYKQMEDKIDLGFDALRQKNLIGDDKLLFTRVLSMLGIYNWLVKDKGCRIKNLARRYGFERPDCRFCDVCRGKPTRLLAARADKVVAKTNDTVNRALRVLRRLEEKCLHCELSSCNGEVCMKGLMCFRCGQPHQSRLCKDKETASEIMNHRACYRCFDLFERRDYRSHDPTECPLGRKLRRMVFARFLPRNGSFSLFLRLGTRFSSSFYHCTYITNN
jgi:superfamily II DNA/RNA helicase